VLAQAVDGSMPGRFERGLDPGELMQLDVLLADSLAQSAQEPDDCPGQVGGISRPSASIL